MFMMVFEHQEKRAVNLKGDPFELEALRQAFPDILPGYHMNKKHWITVLDTTLLDTGMFVDLVTESYVSVVATLPRAQRPVDPATFGRLP